MQIHYLCTTGHNCGKSVQLMGLYAPTTRGNCVHDFIYQVRRKQFEFVKPLMMGQGSRVLPWEIFSKFPEFTYLSCASTISSKRFLS